MILCFSVTLEDSSVCKHFRQSLSRVIKNCLFMQIKVCSPMVSVENSVPKRVREFVVCVDHNSSCMKCMPEA